MKRIVLLLILTSPFSTSAQPDKLPEGDNGIAANYPGDHSISNDPSVILADDFESYTSKDQLAKIWNHVFGRTKLTTDPEGVCHGKQAIEFSVAEKKVMGSFVARFLLDPAEQQDVVFLRYYSKFDAAYNVMGSAHNGGGISSRMFDKNTGRSRAGTRANGKNLFHVTLDHGRLKELKVDNPGFLGIYIYHPGQRHQWGDGFFPNGEVIPFSYKKGDFGPHFVPRPKIVTPLGTWHCHEVMLKANTPGKKDGRTAAWVDGKLVMDFPNLRLRDIPELKIDHLQIGLFVGPGQHPATRKWYDNVVAARTYIGPLKKNE